MHASIEGREVIVEMLLKVGADVNVKLRSGATALHLAASAGSLSAVKLLVEMGLVGVTIKDKEKKTAVDYARESNK